MKARRMRRCCKVHDFPSIVTVLICSMPPSCRIDRTPYCWVPIPMYSEEQ
eukprot:jgi/Mesvir1/16491/Mv25190-RA.1